MFYKKIEIQTKDNLILFGMMSEKKSKKCIMYIPGLSGNYFNTPFANNIAEKCANNGYDFIFTHNRGSFQIYDYQFKNEFGKLKNKTIGSTYELFDDSIYDMDAWYDFAIKEGYEDIVIVAHSRGCNKIINYLSKFACEKIKKIILLAPQDNVTFKNLSIHEGMLEEAKVNQVNNDGEKLLSKKFLGFAYISSNSYIDEVDNKELNNIPYKGIENDFKLINKVNKPIYIIIGDEDIGEFGIKYLENMKNKVKTLKKYKIIDETNHNFKYKEDVLCEMIFKILSK